MTDRPSIDEQAEYWDSHASADPLWAVLSDPAKRGRKWDIDQFFETGRREISLLTYQLEELELAPSSMRACDFGCGIGRLTQGLAPYFQEVIGVDVSATMIRLANRLNRYPDRVSYIHNKAENLQVFCDGHFTFVYSDIVLQHLPPTLSVGYIREFLRVLAANGIAVFQVPDEQRRPDDLPPQRQPLPAAAYRAGIQLMSAVAAPQDLSTDIELLLRVRNEGSHSWREAPGVIRVGNHWRDAATGAMVIQDDGRTDVPPLEPGDSCVLRLRIRTPARAGAFVCEIDVVHEGITWFAHRGSRPAHIQIETTTRLADRPVLQPSGSKSPLQEMRYGSAQELYGLLPADGPHPEDFPMYGVPRGDVESVVGDGRGVIRHIEVDERCGREWVGYRYYVQKLVAG